MTLDTVIKSIQEVILLLSWLQWLGLVFALLLLFNMEEKTY